MTSWLLSLALLSWPRVLYFSIMPKAAKKKSKSKSRSPNIVAYISSNGDDVDLSSYLASNLTAGARLAAENEMQVHEEKTARTYELRLIALEKFARQEGDNAVLFGENKRPFMAATIKTFLREYIIVVSKVMHDLHIHA